MFYHTIPIERIINRTRYSNSYDDPHENTEIYEVTGQLTTLSTAEGDDALAGIAAPTAPPNMLPKAKTATPLKANTETAPLAAPLVENAWVTERQGGTWTNHCIGAFHGVL